MSEKQPKQPIKVGDWVSIDFTANLSWSKSGRVIGVFGDMLRVMQPNGKKFDAYTADAIRRDGPQ